MSIPTTSAAALRIHLSYLRSSTLVAQALATKFPGEGDWLSFLTSEVVADTLEHFAEFINGIRSMIDAGTVIDFDQLEEIGVKHHEAGLAAVDDIAALLEVNPQDILVTLLYG